MPPLAGSGGRQAAADQVGVVRAPLRGAPLRRRFLIMGGSALLPPVSALTPKPPPASVPPLMCEMHVSALISANKCFVILTNGKASKWWYRYTAKNRVFTCFLVHLISIWCSWPRSCAAPGVIGCVRAALLVPGRCSCGRRCAGHPLGWSVAAADAPRCSWPRRCFPARQPSPWVLAGGLQAPRARCGGVGVIVGRLLLLAMPLRRHGVE